MKAIVAVDKNWGIGRNGGLLCHIPGDLKYFMNATKGGIVIMGRKTLESFPMEHPLKGRLNIAISRTAQPDREDEGLWFATSIEEAIKLAERLRSQTQDPERIFCIGGAAIYEQMLDLCSEVLVTRIDKSFDADTFFPNLEASPDWQGQALSKPVEEGDISYQYWSYRPR